MTKGTILEAVREKGLTTIAQVKQCTKASSSCGGCKSLVEEMLTYIQSDSFDEVVEKKTMCACTTLTEDKVDPGNTIEKSFFCKKSDGCAEME